MEYKVVVYVDGGSRGNGTLNAGYGSAIVRTMSSARAVPHTFEWQFDNATNNEAEYRSLLRVLEILSTAQDTEIEIFMDSALVLMQVQGYWQIKENRLRHLQAHCISRIGQITKNGCRIRWTKIGGDEMKGILGH